MTFRENLKRLMLERNLQQKKLAADLELGLSTVSQWLSGVRPEPNPKQRKKLAEYFGISEAELLGLVSNVANAGTVRLIPIIPWFAAREFSVDNPFPPGTSAQYHPTTMKGVKMYALRVKTDCMETKFSEGDIIMVRPELEPEHDDFVIVYDNKLEEELFRQLKKYGKTSVLHSLNPKYPDIELTEKKRYEIVGVVVSKEERFRK